MNWSLVGSLLFGWLIIHTEPRSSPLRLSSYCGSFLSNRTVETRVLPRGNRNAISAALKHSPTVPVFNRLRGGGISGFQHWFMSQFPESVIQASHLHPFRVVFPCTLQPRPRFSRPVILGECWPTFNERPAGAERPVGAIRPCPLRHERNPPHRMQESLSPSRPSHPFHRNAPSGSAQSGSAGANGKGC